MQHNIDIEPTARHALASGDSIGLTTLNARFVHLALAPRCLRNAAREAGFANCWVREFTIATPPWKVAAELLALQPRVLGFSFYIWNRLQTLEVIEIIRAQAPWVWIVAGGPEVSFAEGAHLPGVDVRIAGEGETKWVALLEQITRLPRLDGDAPAATDGGRVDRTAVSLGGRVDRTAVSLGGRVDRTALPAPEMARWAQYGNDLPPLERLPYLPEDLHGLADKLVYLETSRGCPFTCSFCLSALDAKVRRYPEQAVLAMVETLVAAGARRIKFLDRTFNLQRSHTRAFLQRLFPFRGVAFHFEVVGHLLDDETLTMLEEAPPGMFQFEVGIQTMEEGTQQAIGRRQDNTALFRALRALLAAGRVHLHLDLIWGLPGEGLAEIRGTFEQVMALRPHELQLGFLKFLPGAPIRSLIAPEQYRFQSGPPYEVLAHRTLSGEELRGLKAFEDAFARFYNRGAFRATLHRLMEAMGAWPVFAGLAEHLAREGKLVPAQSLEELAEVLLRFGGAHLPAEELRELLRWDLFAGRPLRRVPPALRLCGADGGALPEPPQARAARKIRPGCAIVPFLHPMPPGRPPQEDTHREIAPPNPEPRWLCFDYPPDHGYISHPTVYELRDGEWQPLPEWQWSGG